MGCDGAASAHAVCAAWLCQRQPPGLCQQPCPQVATRAEMTQLHENAMRAAARQHDQDMQADEEVTVKRTWDEEGTWSHIWQGGGCAIVLMCMKDVLRQLCRSAAGSWP